jgi:hypothetical protein
MADKLSAVGKAGKRDALDQIRSDEFGMAFCHFSSPLAILCQNRSYGREAGNLPECQPGKGWLASLDAELRSTCATVSCGLRYHANEFNRQLSANFMLAQRHRCWQSEDRLPRLAPIGEKGLDTPVGEWVPGEVFEHSWRHCGDIGASETAGPMDMVPNHCGLSSVASSGSAPQTEIPWNFSLYIGAHWPHPTSIVKHQGRKVIALADRRNRSLSAVLPVSPALGMGHIWRMPK